MASRAASRSFWRFSSRDLRSSSCSVFRSIRFSSRFFRSASRASCAADAAAGGAVVPAFAAASFCACAFFASSRCFVRCSSRTFFFSSCVGAGDGFAGARCARCRACCRATRSLSGAMPSCSSDRLGGGGGAPPPKRTRRTTHRQKSASSASSAFCGHGRPRRRLFESSSGEPIGRIGELSEPPEKLRRNMVVVLGGVYIVDPSALP